MCVNVIGLGIAVDLLANIFVASKHWVKTVLALKSGNASIPFLSGRNYPSL